MKRGPERKRPKGEPGDLILWVDKQGDTFGEMVGQWRQREEVPGVRHVEGYLPFAVVAGDGRTWRHKSVCNPRVASWYVLHREDPLFGFDFDPLEGFEV